MYAQLCKRLSEEAPNFEPVDSVSTFRLLLINKCKVEFDNRAAAVEFHNISCNSNISNNTLTTNHSITTITTTITNNTTTITYNETNQNQEEDEERRQYAKRKMLGNIKFIGELGKLEILSESVLHRCIQELLVRRGDDPSEDLECLCQIMRTCGRNLDTSKGKILMEQYFDRMKLLTEKNDLPPRIRFMLKDIIDLRQDNWVPRKATVVEGPMPINQIRPQDDDNRSGLSGLGGGGSGSNYNRRNDRNNHYGNDRDNLQDRSNNMSELFRHPMKTRGGLDDMLMNINLSTSSTTSPNLMSTTQFGGGGGVGPNGFSNNSGQQRDNYGRNQRNNSGNGYNNYNNQRGQYKHNQNNTNSQYNNTSNKDIAPRFKKNLIVSKDEIGDVELRPTTMLFNKATIKSNNLMNNSNNRTILDSTFHHQQTTQGTTTTTPLNKPNSVPLLKEPLPIKQVSVDKPKQSKKDKGPTKDEVLKKFTSLLDEYWKGDLDINQAVNSYKEHKVPDKFAKDVILHGLSIVLDKNEMEQEKLIKLLSNLKEMNAINGNIIQESFKLLCNMLDERENEIIKVTNSTSIILSNAILENLTTLLDISLLTENGTHFPLFLLILKKVNEKKGKTELQELFNKSKINLLTQLPENDKTKERLSEILDEYNLTFLYPLLRIQAELNRQLQIDPNPQSYYRWIKDNIDSNNFTDSGFINALMTVLLKYIQDEAKKISNDDEKLLIEHEKWMLERYQHILHAFLHENHSLQLVAVYSLQVHFYSLGFPRGHLLRWFIALYDLEIVEEEAFLNWREDVTDAYPGKGQALFQVNQWLTWLQEAESEEEEGED